MVILNLSFYPCPFPIPNNLLLMTNFSIFLLAALALAITPGPDTLYVAARSIGQGRSAGIISVLGICVGLLVHILAATIGLSALLMSSATVYSFVKTAGAAYLIYLGIRMLFSGKTALKTLNHSSLRQVFSQGILSSTLNPKLALFFLAFLPQFVEPSRGYVAAQTLLLGGLFAGMGAIWLLGVALLTSQLGNWLQQHPKLGQFQQRFTGSILIGLGIHLAIPERQ